MDLQGLIGGRFPPYMSRRAFKVTVPHGVQQRLAWQFGVSKMFVHYVLRQERGGKKAKEIVKAAMDMGGYWEKK